MLTDEEEQARKERRELIKTLIELHPLASDRVIAEMVRERFRYCSHTTVNKIRKEMKGKK